MKKNRRRAIGYLNIKEKKETTRRELYIFGFGSDPTRFWLWETSQARAEFTSLLQGREPPPSLSLFIYTTGKSEQKGPLPPSYTLHTRLLGTATPRHRIQKLLGPFNSQLGGKYTWKTIKKTLR